MKFTIKEVKEKFEQDDKVKFTAKVKNVYDAKELTPEQKAKAKYTFSRQNIIVEDETDSIKVIISQKSKEDEYLKDIIEKEVEVDGKLSIWEGKKNIFGKLIFKTGEAPASKTTATTKGTAKVSTIPIVIEVRRASLKLALEFWTARIGDKMEEGKIIKTANRFYLYLTGKTDKVTVQKKGTVREEEEKAEVEKEGEDIKKEEELSAKKIELINSIMKLKEEHRIDAEVFKSHCNGKEIKILTIEELEKIKKILNEQTDEIPF